MGVRGFSILIICLMFCGVWVRIFRLFNDGVSGKIFFIGVNLCFSFRL